MLNLSFFRVTSVLLIAFAGLMLAVPNVLTEGARTALSSIFPARTVVLGLDLQGGSHLLLAVDTDTLRRDQTEALRGEVRDALRDQRIGYTGLAMRENGVQVRIRDAAAVDGARAAIEALAQPVTTQSLAASTARTIEVDVNGDLITATMTDEGINARIRAAVSQSIEVVRRRIDQLGTVEPNIQRQGDDRILVQVPGLDDPERLKALLGQTAQLSFRLVDTSMTPEQALQTRPPAESEVLMSSDGLSVPYLVERQILISGEMLTDAQPGFDQRTGEPIVSFRFNSQGAQRFGNVTRVNVGRPFAIVLDNEVISAPVIREPILGGSGQISGSFTVEAANDLAILLRAGALPAPLEIIEERTVGPGLGQDSIEAGGIAAMIGAGAVIVFMVATYGLFGLFANIALILNIIMLFGLLSLLQATLTLPGIAGIVLTLGMAVDSNVLIFERIREEARAGRSAVMAIDTGFRKAFDTIVDANVTTLLTGIILFVFGGSGPVRGFAVTLSLGIITTVFTAFFFTSLMFALWVRARRPRTLPI